MGDMQRLQGGIENGLRSNKPTIIAIHRPRQAEQGKCYARRAALQIGGDPKKLNFRVISPEYRAITPPGTILPV